MFDENPLRFSEIVFIVSVALQMFWWSVGFIIIHDVSSQRATVVSYFCPLTLTGWPLKISWIKLLAPFEGFLLHWKWLWLKTRRITCSTSGLGIFCWEASMWFPSDKKYSAHTLCLISGEEAPDTLSPEWEVTSEGNKGPVSASLSAVLQRGVGAQWVFAVSLSLSILFSEMVAMQPLGSCWACRGLGRGGLDLLQEVRALALHRCGKDPTPGPSVKPSSLPVRACHKANVPSAMCIKVPIYRQILNSQLIFLVYWSRSQWHFMKPLSHQLPIRHLATSQYMYGRKEHVIYILPCKWNIVNDIP